MTPPCRFSTTGQRDEAGRCGTAARGRDGLWGKGGARMLGRARGGGQGRFSYPLLLFPVLLMVSAGWGSEIPGPPSPAPSRGWPALGGGPQGIRYSPLDQINRTNVRQLAVAWTFDSGEEGGLQASPIVVGGVVYTTTPKHHVVALDAATGTRLWKFDSGIPLSGANRGVTYWESG